MKVRKWARVILYLHLGSGNNDCRHGFVGLIKAVTKSSRWRLVGEIVLRFDRPFFGDTSACAAYCSSESSI